MDWIITNIYRFWQKIGRRLRTGFYIYLAAIISFFVIADSLYLRYTEKKRQTSFDLLIKHRILLSKPDPDIVIVDINEASLAALAKDYGRWPWPRQVMGEFVEQLEKQRPKAVVFDIMFSDPDIYNPDSDAYFNEAIGLTNNTFFPILRLDAQSDGLSSLLPEQIPGAVPIEGQAAKDRHIAVVLPFFDSAMKGGRLGLNNIYPDDDGIVRLYPVHRRDYGWLLPSLPSSVVSNLGLKLPERDNILLNWRGRPFTYKYISFADVFSDMIRKERKRPQDEFAGKIVIIGSTAAGLFDVKPTPIDRLHPGVEILATAIDNLKHDDYIRTPDTRVLSPVLALLIIWLTAMAFYRNAGQEIFDRLFGTSQFLLLGVSYASINLLNTYINLTGPVMYGIAYFSGARIYAAATKKILEKSAVMSSVSTRGELYAALMLVRLGSAAEPVREMVAERFRRAIGRRVKQAKSVETLKGSQKGIWGLFEGVTVVSWTCPFEDEDNRRLIMEEANNMEAVALDIWLSLGGRPETIAVVFHEGSLDGGRLARAGWTSLIGGAITRMSEAERIKT